MHKLIFTTLAVPGKSELDTLLLANSIRNFSGKFAKSPIWAMVPAGLGSLSKTTQEKLNELETKIIPFEADPDMLNFPFAAKIEAAATIEAQAQGQTQRVAFMDRDTIFLQEPSEFLLSSARAFGYRPVHHKLIGSSWNEPLDSFWQLVFEVCEVPDDILIPMMTHTGEKIRPYFSAGIYVIRPEKGILAKWRELFQKWYQQPQFQAFYEKDQLYAIFVHQAIFSGVLLHNLKSEEMFELSPQINYPLHLHHDIPAQQRPVMIDDLVTVRYESIFDEPGWEQLPITESLQSWLKAQPKLQSHYL